jgi:uncharacterized protein (TIGR03435 family)
MKRRRVVATAGWVVVVGLAGVAALRAPRARAQSQNPAAGRPSFEVASVKQNKSADRRVQIGLQPGGRFTATNVPLRMLIRNAYQLQDAQIISGPGWIDTERFDVVAKAEGNPAPAQPGGPPGPMQLMLQSLLEERFKLRMHRETQELPIFALTMARSDRRLGPQLRQAAVDCQALIAAARARGEMPTPSPATERPNCGMRIGPGQLSGGGFPLSQLAVTLSGLVQRIVIDRTGLSGTYDLDLSWTPDVLPQNPAGAPPLPPIDPNGPSLYTALQEQLGLKLESQRGPVEVMVIDSVQPPTPD